MQRVEFYPLLLMVACGVPRPATPSSEAVVAAQLERGAAVYSAHCARCHGDAGEGTDRAPALLGAGALPERPRDGQRRSVDFRTALDIAAFATANMPPNERHRRRLSETDYWDVLAFALHGNGIRLTAPVSAANAGQIDLRPR